MTELSFLRPLIVPGLISILVLQLLLKHALKFIKQLLEFTLLAFLRFAKYPYLFNTKYEIPDTKYLQRGFIKLSKHALISYMIVSTVLVGTGIIFLFNPFGGGPKSAEAAWFNDNWAYRKAITFTHNSAETYVVAKFDIDTTDAPEKIQSSCNDIRFTDSSGKLLRYYFDSAVGACDTSSSDFYILLPTVINGSNLIYMYYGNPSAAAVTESTYPTTTASLSSQAPAYVQSDISQGTTGDGTEAVSFSSTPTVGNTVVVACLTNDSAETWVDGSVTDNQGNSYTKVLEADAGSNLVTVIYYGRILTSSGTFTVTCNPSGTTSFITNTVHEYSGILRSSPVAASNTNTGSGTSVSTGNVTTTEDDDLYFAAMTSGGAANDTITPTGASWNEREEDQTTDGMPTNTEDKVTTASTQSETWTAANAGWAAGIVAFKPSYIIALSGSPSAGSEEKGPTPVGYWKLDEGTGNTISNSVTGSGGVTYIQSNSNQTGAAAANVAVSFDTTPTPGNLVVVATAGFNCNATGEVSDNQGNSYSRIVTKEADAGTAVYLSIYYAYNVNSNGTFTVTFDCGANGGSTNDQGVSVHEYAGILTTDPLDKSAIASGNTGLSPATISSGNVVTTIDGELYFGAATQVNETWSITVGTGYTMREELTDNSNAQGHATEDKVANAGTHAATFTAENTQWAAGIATFKPKSTGQPLGIISGSAWRTEDQCISSKCLWFDGSNDVVAVPDTASMDFGASDNFTVSAWVKHNGPISTNPDYILSKADATNGGYKLWMDSDGDFCFGIDDDSSWTPDISACSDTNADFDDDQWHFVEGVRHTTDDVLYLYVDGIKRATSSTDTTSATLANSNRLVIGADRDETSNPWFGFIDEVKVYKDQTARTEAQIKADYNARSNPEGAALQTANTQNMPGALTNGLVGYWKMDETADNSCTGGTNDYCDSSGNGIDGAQSGGATHAAGKFNNSVDLDGTDDYISITDNAAFDFNKDTSKLTWAFWINPDDFEEWNAVWTQQTSTTNQVTILAHTSADTDWDVTNGIAVGAQSSTNNNIIVSTTDNALTTGAWQHVVVTYDGTQTQDINKFTIYVNGVDKTDRSDTSGIEGTLNTTISPTDIRIGSDGTANENEDGKVDDFRYYTRALSGAEVSQLYNWAPGPIGYWRFDERVGTTAFDASGNGNSATLTNGPTFTTGKYGAGLSFAGSNAHVTRADDSDFDFSMAGASFTYEAWVKHTSTPATAERIITKYDNSATNGGFALQMETDGDLTCGIDDDQTSFPEDSAVSTAATYDDNNWHHIACVKDGTTGLYLYIDGTLIASDTSISSTGNFDNADPLYIGIAEDGTSNDWLGQLDEPKIYNYSRTASQIVEDMNAGHPAPGSPLGTPKYYFKFDEGYGTTVNSSGNTTKTGTMTSMSSPATSTSGWSQSGKFGKGLSFDGTDDFVSVTTPALPTGDFAYTAWVYIADTGQNRAIIGSDTGAAGDNDEMLITREGSDNKLHVYIDNGTSVITSTHTAPTSAWTHIALTRSGSNVTLYVNGAVDGTGTSSATLDFGSCRLTIGADNTGACATIASPMNGAIDEVKVYTEALTASQVALDMNRASAQVMGALSDNSAGQSVATSASANQEYCIPGDSTTCTSPIMRWDFNERTGTTANDISGNAKSAAFGASTAAPTWTTGKIGGGINFDGTDDTLGVTSASPPTGDYTYEAWVYHRSGGASLSESLFSSEQGADTDEFQFSINSSDQLQVRHQNTGVISAGSTTLANNTWYHVAATRSGSAVKVYLNGKEDGSGTSGVTLSFATCNWLYIGVDPTNCTGGNNTTFGSFWNGIIDQPKIFNYARSAAQIAWDYNRGAPIAYWKMDECQGTTINDSAGNSLTGTLTIGASGEDTVGTCTTSSTAWGNGATGKRNYSMDFDGTDDYVTVSDANALDVTTNFTLSAWVNADAIPGGCSGSAPEKEAIINKGRDSTTTYAYFTGIDCGTNAGKFEFSLFDGTNNPTTFSNTAFSTGTWYHVVGTYDGSTLKNYVNGVLQTTTSSSISIGNQTSPLVIGKNANNSDRYFNGRIDDARVYNYPLTAAQIKTLYNDGAARFGPSTGAP